MTERSEPSPSVISAQQVVKRFGDRTVIHGVSFEVRKGECLALVGPSGGGKSTLLRCMHGLEVFEGGSFTIVGATLKAGPAGTNREALARVRAKAGLVFQQWHLFAHMTALENVMEAPVQVRHVPKDKAREQARALLEKVGLSHREHALPRRLSGGEQQRVAIARALAMEPEVLFLDEPTSALDPQRVASLADLLRALAAEGLTLVSVTHDMRFAKDLCERVIVLEGGNIVANGPPREVLKDVD